MAVKTDKEKLAEANKEIKEIKAEANKEIKEIKAEAKEKLEIEEAKVGFQNKSIAGLQKDIEEANNELAIQSDLQKDLVKDTKEIANENIELKKEVKRQKENNKPTEEKTKDINAALVNQNKELITSNEVKSKKLELAEEGIEQLNEEIEALEQKNRILVIDLSTEKNNTVDLRKELRASNDKKGKSTDNKIGCAKNPFAELLEARISLEKDSSADLDQFDTFELKGINTKFLGQYINTCYDNPEKLKGAELRAEIVKGEMRLLHTFINYETTDISYLESSINIDEAIVNNLNINKVLTFIVTGEDEEGNVVVTIQTH